MGAGAVALGVAGYLLGRTSGAPVTVPSSSPLSTEVGRRRWMAKLPWARAYAEQPIAVLSANYATFLMVIEQTGGDEATWRGFAKLAAHALSPAGADDHILRRQLLRACELAPPPEWLHATLQRLAEGR
jgi:hypothetical protein